MKSQPTRKPAERRCSECNNLYPFKAYSNIRWNNKNRVCCNCKPFSGRTRAGKRVAEKVRAETSDKCKAWPIDGKCNGELTFWRYCNARKNLRPVPDDCYGCKIKTMPANVGIMDTFFSEGLPF